MESRSSEKYDDIRSLLDSFVETGKIERSEADELVRKIDQVLEKTMHEAQNGSSRLK